MRAKVRFFSFIIFVFFIQIVLVSVAAAATRIMPLGDSITMGTCCGKPTEEMVAYRQKLYLDLIDKGYDVDFVGGEQAGGSAVPAFDIDHEGHGGWEADEIRNEVYYWLVNNPADIVLLHIGTNDISWGQSAAGILDEIDQILTEIDAYEDDYSAEVMVILARIINRQDPNSEQSLRTTELNGLLQTLVDYRSSSGDKICDVDQESALSYPGDMDDNVHPNMTGYNKMANVWLSELEQILPAADFTADPISGAYPLTVNFTDESKGNIASWEWDFGDNSPLSNEQDPAHTYEDPGTYTVILTVTGPGGSDTETKEMFINVTMPIPKPWYVDSDVVTSGNGTSWDEAFKTIKEAVAAAYIHDEIWVKQGTYYIDSTIEMNTVVAIYGGFNGTETERNQRHWENNVTTVDGQNAIKHCFYIGADATIDGFTITGGGTGIPGYSGGGIYSDSPSPIVANCIFTGNNADYGGGIANYQSSPTIVNCSFFGNSAASGGGISNRGSSVPTIINCIFSGNNSDYGGGIYCHDASPIITNCTFSANESGSSGGGIYNYNSSPIITNCILWEDSPDEIFNDASSNATVTYSDVQMPNPTDVYSGVANINEDPLFVDPTHCDCHLTAGSPCIDKGDPNAPSLPLIDFEGDDRTIGAAPDMGADEYLARIIVGLGSPQGQGFMEAINANPPYNHLDWLRVPWPAYNTAAGGTHPCLCNLDDDPYDELVVGLDSYQATGGYVEIRDDRTTGYAHLSWLRVPWPVYNAANGATYPTCGDFDGDGRNELAIGLGTYTATGGYVEIRDDYTTGFAHMAWVRVPWPAYNSANGATYPAAGDFDGDGKDELAIGLGAYTSTGGYVEIRDDATTGFAHMAWPRVPWPAYNSANGATHPACGDLDGDGRAELAIGLGGYPARGGYVEIKDDAIAGFTHLAWPRVPWPAYNAANGATYPACGNLDGDEVYELAIGLGTYTTKGGYVEIKDDLGNGFAHMGWPRVHWPAYNSANGETRPGLGETDPLPALYFPPPGEGLDKQDQRTPEEVGLNSAVVSQLMGKATRWALWRHGFLVYAEGDFNVVEEVRSLRKTFHALTVGAAIKQRKIPSYNQKISVWQTELTGNDADATWLHVMTQSAGFDYPGCGDSTDYQPGQMWTYSDFNPYHLCHALAKAYGKNDYYDNYDNVIREAYFDAVGMQGWSTTTRDDGIRFQFDLEDMGRLGLLLLARGRWDGQEIVPQWFVEELETKQSYGMLVNYDGCHDGDLCFDPEIFPEAPYGYMTWVNTDGDLYPDADTGWAYASGAGGIYLLWNYKNGIVFAAFYLDEGSDCHPVLYGIPHIIEANIAGPNPLSLPSRH